jgi:hypothetical protein
VRRRRTHPAPSRRGTSWEPPPATSFSIGKPAKSCATPHPHPTSRRVLEVGIWVLGVGICSRRQPSAVEAGS